ncbi:MAG TPA: ParA family protein [Caulobacteraceae bacterium]|nr:ParA family protein [Caulobacteraceae bacterium]
MRTIAFISPKGGAGKTTAALLLALGLADRGFTVAMIDADPNKPLMDWAALPGRPAPLTVHPAPTILDVRDVYRGLRRREPDWVLLDTEGSIVGASAFAAVRADVVVTPLAGSQLEAAQAIKAAGMVAAFGHRGGRPIPHRCLLTRIPAAIRPRSLKVVVELLKQHQIEFLPTALLEKEAFRALFDIGGGFKNLEAARVGGLVAAHGNAEAYLDAVLDLVPAAPAEAGLPLSR